MPGPMPAPLIPLPPEPPPLWPPSTIGTPREESLPRPLREEIGPLSAPLTLPPAARAAA